MTIKLYYITAEDNGETFYFNKETKKFLTLKRFSTAWTNKSECEVFLESKKDNLSTIWMIQFGGEGGVPEFKVENNGG